MTKTSRQHLFELCGIYFLWSAAIFLLAWLAPQFFPYQPSFPYAKQLAQASQLPAFLYSFANFDGVHYLTIARQGYLGTGLIQAFFPLYPVFIWLLTPIIGNQLLSALVLSQFTGLTAFLMLYIFVEKHYSSKIAWKASLLFLFFASSFFLHAVYNEGLFLTFLFAGLYFFDQKKYLWAALFGLLASATRIVGVFIFPMYLILLFSDLHSNLKSFLQRNIWKILLLSLSLFGLFAYMIYLYLLFKDPLYFYHVQGQFGAGRQTELVLLPQVIWRYLKIFSTVDHWTWSYYSYLQEFLLSIWALLLLFWLTWRSWQRKISFQAGYLFFAWAVYLLPTFTGNFSSMPRYLLACFPLFLGMALSWKKKNVWLYRIYFFTQIILSIINVLLFIQGYWVA
jgi:Gpi18-like mannosyltransferase